MKKVMKSIKEKYKILQINKKDKEMKQNKTKNKL